MVIVFCKIFQRFHKRTSMCFHLFWMKDHISIERIAPDIISITFPIRKAKICCHVCAKFSNSCYVITIVSVIIEFLKMLQSGIDTTFAHYL